MTLDCITLDYIRLLYITLDYIRLHDIRLHYIRLHYIRLHYITLDYITSIHPSIHLHAYLHGVRVCLSAQSSPYADFVVQSHT